MANTEIRRLTIEDYPAIEAVLDSRKGSFQGQKFSDDWHNSLKENYVRKRLEWTNWVFFFGFFEDGKLIAIRDFRRSDRVGEYVIGISWTLKGHPIPKHPGSDWPAPIVELRHYAIDFLLHPIYSLNSIWQNSPKGPNTWSRTTLPADDQMYNPAVFSETVVETVPAGTKSSDAFIAHCVLFDHIFPVDQVITRFDLLNPPNKHPVPDPSKTSTVTPTWTANGPIHPS